MMGADVLVMQAARASATMLLTVEPEQFSPHILRFNEFQYIFADPMVLFKTAAEISNSGSLPESL